MKKLLGMLMLVMWVSVGCSNNDAEIQRIHQSTCEANLETLAIYQVMFFADSGTYSSNILDLSTEITECPDGGHYLIHGEATSFKVECPNGHGAIVDGIKNF